jgi:hypothetical protein
LLRLGQPAILSLHQHNLCDYRLGTQLSS